ncbi:hypothetical protein LWI29_002387 [Acer saccharum]|uniref:RNase H type-1 domain-containing protein n=1 Tax=Acer saccharum TaxID=4024 RepID=A0AA39S640_ACESA|nr:hypothetical protein LWI29_002387 [Acer saccharum]
MPLHKETIFGDRNKSVGELRGAQGKGEKLECMERNKHISHITVGSISGEVEITDTKLSYKWKPSVNDAYKANYDAVLDLENGQMGIRVIIINSGGMVLASCSLVSDGNLSPKVAKLLAILRCLQFGIDCSLAVENIEKDEASVVKWTNDVGYLEADFGMVISEILDLKEKMVLGDALRTNRDSYWMEDYPLWIRKVVEADMPN